MKIRAKQLARELGLSPATISLVQNNKPGVSEKTRKLVLQALEEHGILSAGSQPVVKSKNGNIRFVVFKRRVNSYESAPFYGGILEGAERQARQSGYNIAMTYLNREQDSLSEAIEVIRSEKPDGIIMLATEMSQAEIELFLQLNMPLVAVDNPLETLCCSGVSIDNLHGARQAAEYLIECGHKRIGYLRSAFDISNFRQRERGLRMALAEHGLRLDESDLYDFNMKATGCYDRLLKNLNDGKSPTAFFADNDSLAIEVMKIIKSIGLKIPDDVSIIGFDNDSLCEVVEPHLTTVHVYKDYIGTIAVQALVDIIEGGRELCVKQTVSTKLIIRDSVSCLEPDEAEQEL